MLSALALALQAATPAPIPYRPDAVPLRRLDWLSKEDFPAEQAEAASTAFAARLDVSPEGKVDECVVIKSSGQPPFDARSCSVLAKRARFDPALDETGTPKASAYTYRLPWAAVTKPVPRGSGAWLTGDDYPSKSLREDQQGRAVVLAVIEANGRVSDCQVTTSSGHADLDEATCRVVRRRGRYTPAVDAEGQPVASTAPYIVNWRLPDE